MGWRANGRGFALDGCVLQLRRDRATLEDVGGNAGHEVGVGIGGGAATATTPASITAAAVAPRNVLGIFSRNGFIVDMHRAVSLSSVGHDIGEAEEDQDGQEGKRQVPVSRHGAGDASPVAGGGTIVMSRLGGLAGLVEVKIEIEAGWCASRMRKRGD